MSGFELIGLIWVMIVWPIYFMFEPWLKIQRQEAERLRIANEVAEFELEREKEEYYEQH